jgi:membrane protein
MALAFRAHVATGAVKLVFAYFRAPIGWRELARRTVVDTFEDGCPGLAAQLAFYFLLALFPALLFVVALLSYLPLGPALTSSLDRLELIVPADVLRLVRQLLQDALTGVHGGVLTFAVAGALWSSSSAVTAIITALNRAYDIEEWRPWWKRRLIATVLTVGLATFVVLALALVVGGSDLAEWAADRIGVASLLTRAGTAPQWIAAVMLIVLAVDLVYYLAPNADAEWVWITPGALLATALWLIASVGFKVYVQNFGTYSAAQGAIGGVVVLMLWFYLSGFALLMGAELNAEIDKAMPTRDGAQRPGREKKIGSVAEEASADQRR